MCADYRLFHPSTGHDVLKDVDVVASSRSSPVHPRWVPCSSTGHAWLLPAPAPAGCAHTPRYHSRKLAALAVPPLYGLGGDVFFSALPPKDTSGGEVSGSRPCHRAEIDGLTLLRELEESGRVPLSGDAYNAGGDRNSQSRVASLTELSDVPTFVVQVGGRLGHGGGRVQRRRRASGCRRSGWTRTSAWCLATDGCTSRTSRSKTSGSSGASSRDSSTRSTRCCLVGARLASGDVYMSKSAQLGGRSRAGEAGQGPALERLAAQYLAASNT